MASFLINGRAAEELPLADRAIHYGDGLFETIAVRQGVALCWDAHMRRLEEGCRRLNIPLPESERLLEEAEQLIAGQQRAVIKIIISRGNGGRGYEPPQPCTPVRIMARYPWPDYPASLYKEGLACTLSGVRLGRAPLLAGLKHLNRLEQVLGRDDVSRRGYREGLMQDIAGNVVEGTMSNLFLISGDRLVTPSLEYCGVAGIVRRFILERADAWGLQAVITELGPAELEQAGEVFVCNSVLGVCPVSRVDDMRWPPGDKTRTIRQNLVDDGVIIDT